ncbi:DEAD/DEAH box helicase family protein [Salicola sp. Rm-C-2C1-2]|uniref:DEAD/DEAH box helicase family protein n=1 Tax=Salicola sp. Rm-C-2C1-2 TaxID=3141321 RepID=UPI0032E410EB
MELKLYNRLKHELLGDLAGRSEGHDPDYQKQVESYAAQPHSGVSKRESRKIQRWLETYNRLLPGPPVTLRYYQILALYFTEHVLKEKRGGKRYNDQKALAYWMATGSGKTLLMHLNILQYIDHIGGPQSFDELQIILTTPGVNLIEQHQRELGEVVRHLNRIHNNRIKLIADTTGALLNREKGFFQMPENPRIHRLVLVDEGHIGLSTDSETGAFKALRSELLHPTHSFLFEYSATYHGIAETHVREYEEQIVYDYNYYRFFRDGYGKDYAFQSLNDDRFADTAASTAPFFTATFGTLAEKLTAFDNLSVSRTQRAGELPFTGSFPDRPLLAFMGGTVEDPKKEGGARDEVSDIRKLLVWLANLSPSERYAFKKVWGEAEGRLRLTRSPGIIDEIWLSWGNGDFWGLINVGNGEKFFRDCETHQELRDDHGAPLMDLDKARIVSRQYRFAAIDEPTSPINLLVGSRKFAEGWNCFRVSIIGLINLGSNKGNKIIQIFGRGVRLEGLNKDGKRRYRDHCPDYDELVRRDEAEDRLRRLETLNVFSLNQSWLKTFLEGLEKDIPALAGPFTVDVTPRKVSTGGKLRHYDDYQPWLHAPKVGGADFDALLRITLDATDNSWHWEYVIDGHVYAGQLHAPELRFDYRIAPEETGHDLIQPLAKWIDKQAPFLNVDHLKEQLRAWSRQQKVQLYVARNSSVTPLSLRDLLSVVGAVRYDWPLNACDTAVVERLLAELQRDTMEKVFHKVRYDIDKRHYRYEPVTQSLPGQPGDFIDRYRITCEFDTESDRQAFESDSQAWNQLRMNLQESPGHYHIYEPLFGDAEGNRPHKHTNPNIKKIRRVSISPDRLNDGERKFLEDLNEFVENNYAHDRRQFYLMRNVDSLKSIGIYLDGETRVFHPDFVLWIVDDKTNQTTLAFFDPKGESGIMNRGDLGLSGGGAMNDKVRLSNSGQLADLAHQLTQQTGRHWSIHSYILLRDSSELGRFKGSAPTEPELTRAEEMINRGVLRLDWHKRDEQGNPGKLLRNDKSYLNRIFENLL